MCPGGGSIGGLKSRAITPPPHGGSTLMAWGHAVQRGSRRAGCHRHSCCNVIMYMYLPTHTRAQCPRRWCCNPTTIAGPPLLVGRHDLLRVWVNPVIALLRVVDEEISRQSLLVSWFGDLGDVVACRGSRSFPRTLIDPEVVEASRPLTSRARAGEWVSEPRRSLFQSVRIRWWYDFHTSFAFFSVRTLKSRIKC